MFEKRKIETNNINHNNINDNTKYGGVKKPSPPPTQPGRGFAKSRYV